MINQRSNIESPNVNLTKFSLIRFSLVVPLVPISAERLTVDLVRGIGNPRPKLMPNSSICCPRNSRKLLLYLNPAR